ncbi:MAG: hypothetical protein GPJ54_08810 [Candidatus Heimdallarchaeota archaeon]|nr:hypothetical protein [Candidatus Heimdallarchaeota archaeon]
MYDGFKIGASGIGDFLIDALLAGFDSGISLLHDIINRLKHSFFNETSDGIYWGKYSSFDSDGYLGIRFGNMGIINFLARAQYEGIVDDVTVIIEEGYRWVKNQQLEDGRWPYAPGGYTTTGQEYGASGIASSLITLSNYLEDESYLNEAKDIGSWIIGQGKFEGDLFIIPWTLEGEGTEFDGYRMTGIGTGSAGILDLMIDLYKITNDNKYLETANGLANDLISRDLGGYWADSSYSYVTRLLAHTALTGFNAGSTGIADRLLRIFDLTGNIKYLEASIRSEKWLEQFIYANGSVSMSQSSPERFYTGLSLGSAGVAKFFINLFSRYNEVRHFEYVSTILTHLSQLLALHNQIPVQENELNNGFGFSIDDGIAGIGTVVLQYIENGMETPITNAVANSEYNAIYSSAEVSTDIPSTTGESDSNDTYLMIYIPIVFLIIFAQLLTKPRRKL